MPRIPVLLATLVLLAGCTGETVTTGPVGEAPRATGVRVVDGDTVAATVAGADVVVRLVGINAPERDECHGDDATRALSDALAAGRVRVVAVGTTDRDDFGRLLRAVEVDGRDLGLEMVRAGHALAMSVDHPRAAEYRAAQEEAFAAALGMWGPAACGTPAGTGASIAGIEHDPPGDEAADPNLEWVDIRADEAVDLGGWRLRDESSAHRFDFPAGLTLAPGAVVRVHSGCGADDAATLHWCADTPVWNNGGDTVLLQDPHGNVVDRFGY